MRVKIMESKGKLPSSALSLYVKLYCKRKGDTATKYFKRTSEAIKSWLLLSKDEKEQFADILKECRSKYKKKFADHLKSAEPYLLRKHTRRNKENNFRQNETEDNPQDVCNIRSARHSTFEDNATSKTDFHQSCEVLNGNNQNEIEDIPAPSSPELLLEPSPVVNEVLNNNDSNQNDIEDISAPPSPEPLMKPTPPVVKSAKELFEMVNASNNDERTWQSLSSKEKTRYQSAVRALKKDYISKYKIYLENLPSKDLFDYYNKKI